MLSNRIIKLLVIEDESYDVHRIENTLKPFQKNIRIVDVVATGLDALEKVRQSANKYDVIIMDFQIAGGLNGENLIREIKKIEPLLQIIVVTKMTVNITDFEFASKLIDAGAMWYCTKYPVDIEDYIYQPTDFLLSIFNAYEKKRIEKARIRSEVRLNKNIAQLIEDSPIIGTSDSILKVKQQILQCARTGTTVLINGPSGTGKELVARHIHYHSQRCHENFVPINCGSIPSELIESELFGFEKGSFTGAVGKKAGLFEQANQGTLFLDEVAELPKAAQVKLLRVLQEGEIEKIGRTKKIKVNTRIIAATNKNLADEVAAGRFREDLFYRLNVYLINLPELSGRAEDIPLLFDHFLNYFCELNSMSKPLIDVAAKNELQKFPWPGNVRQLQNVAQRLLLGGKGQITKDDIQSALSGTIHPGGNTGHQNSETGWSAEDIRPWREMERELRSKYFTFVRQNSVSDAEAARKLGLAPPNYYRMCKELGIK